MPNPTPINDKGKESSKQTTEREIPRTPPRYIVQYIAPRFPVDRRN